MFTYPADRPAVTPVAACTSHRGGCGSSFSSLSPSLSVVCLAPKSALLSSVFITFSPSFRRTCFFFGRQRLGQPRCWARASGPGYKTLSSGLRIVSRAAEPRLVRCPALPSLLHCGVLITSPFVFFSSIPAFCVAGALTVIVLFRSGLSHSTRNTIPRYRKTNCAVSHMFPKLGSNLSYRPAASSPVYIRVNVAARGVPDK